MVEFKPCRTCGYRPYDNYKLSDDGCNREFITKGGKDCWVPEGSIGISDEQPVIETIGV